MQIPNFEDWFQAKYFQTFDYRYCYQGNHQSAILMAYIRHSHEYMQEQLQAIADEQIKPK